MYPSEGRTQHQRNRAPVFIGVLVVLILGFSIASYFLSNKLQKDARASQAQAAPAPQPAPSQSSTHISTTLPTLSYSSPKPAAPNVEPLPPEPPKPSYPLLNLQPTEMSQLGVPFTMEQCVRVHPTTIQCWGYVSNENENSINVGFEDTQVVDDQGNPFSVRGFDGGIGFGNGFVRFTIPAKSRVKYVAKIPDSDPNAGHLTLHIVASNNLTDLRYTFENVPVYGTEKAPSNDGAKN